MGWYQRRVHGELCLELENAQKSHYENLRCPRRLHHCLRPLDHDDDAEHGWHDWWQLHDGQPPAHVHADERLQRLELRWSYGRSPYDDDAHGRWHGRHGLNDAIPPHAGRCHGRRYAHVNDDVWWYGRCLNGSRSNDDRRCCTEPSPYEPSPRSQISPIEVIEPMLPFMCCPRNVFIFLNPFLLVCSLYI